MAPDQGVYHKTGRFDTQKNPAAKCRFTSIWAVRSCNQAFCELIHVLRLPSESFSDADAGATCCCRTKPIPGLERAAIHINHRQTEGHDNRFKSESFIRIRISPAVIQAQGTIKPRS